MEIGILIGVTGCLIGLIIGGLIGCFIGLLIKDDGTEDGE